MAITIRAPRNSFIQWAEANATESCQFDPITLCLPVYQDNDIYFQFILETDTQEEADSLCDIQNALVTIGIAESCENDMVLEFSSKAERYRIGTNAVLYNWQHGLPGFGTVISRGQCFIIKIAVQGIYTLYDFCSNCLQRIADPCHTSVIEYGNDDNAFGFDYCGGAIVEGAGATDCTPTFITFTNQANITIPYTTSMQQKYGTVPSVQTWIYDGDELVDMGIRASFDQFPPTLIKIDFGGISSGVIKIS